jgi:hypothetical protein
MSDTKIVVYPTNMKTRIEEGVFEALDSILTSNVMFSFRDTLQKYLDLELMS